MIILIPSYEPTFRLLDVVAGIRGAVPWLTVLVVDDGSGPDYAPCSKRRGWPEHAC